MPTNKPFLPTIVQLPTSTAGTVTISSKERHPFALVATRQADITLPGGQVDPVAVSRFLSQIQQNVAQATLPARSSNYTSPVTVRSVTMVSPTPTVIKHGLGEVPGGWDCKRVHPGSAPFAAAEAAFNSANWPANYSQEEYLVLIPSATGVYDIAIYPS
jgi:hypothetical protein